MSLLTLAALAGYFVGSISFARIVARVVIPAADLTTARIGIREGAEVETGGVSATSLSMLAGARWGWLVSMLDIAKALIVTLLFRAAAPDEPADLVAATFVVVGHVWPIWHRFRGGFGVTAILGGLVVIDALALAVCIALGLAVGAILRDRVFMFDGWMLFLVPWFLVVRQDPAEVLYAAVVVLIYRARTLGLRRELRSRA